MHLDDTLKYQKAVTGYAIVNPEILAAYEAAGFDRSTLPASLREVLEAVEKGVAIEHLHETLTPATKQHLERAGGLSSLIDPDIATETNALWGVRALTDNLRRANLLSRLTEIYKEVEKGLSLPRCGALLSSLGGEVTPTITTSPRGAQELTEALLERLDQEREPLPVRTGVEDCDRYLGTLVGGELIVVGARPGVGKTSWATQVAIESAKVGLPSLFLTTEMPEDAIWERITSQESRVNSQRLKMPKLLNEHDRTRVYEASEALSSLPLHVLDVGYRSIDELVGLVRRQVTAHGLRVIFVDYLQRLFGSDKRTSRYEEVSEISRKLKTLAVETRTVVIALAQFSRPPKDQESKLPTMASLRDSGQIEQDADMIFLFSRGDDENTIVQVAKNRHGPIGTFPLGFEAHCTRFTKGKPMEKQSGYSDVFDSDAGF